MSLQSLYCGKIVSWMVPGSCQTTSANKHQPQASKR